MCACQLGNWHGEKGWWKKKKRMTDFSTYIKILGEWTSVNHRICLYYSAVKNSTIYNKINFSKEKTTDLFNRFNILSNIYIYI